MAEIIKCYSQEVPPVRFIGKKYYNDDRVNGSFGAKWVEWFQNGWFDELEQIPGAEPHKLYCDGDAYLGLMRAKDGEPFEYWIGEFLQPGSAVPDGFAHVDFPAGKLGTCWIYGSENNDNIYGMHDECVKKLAENALEFDEDPSTERGGYWFFERYGCPRFTTPDENGKIILDYCIYAK